MIAMVRALEQIGEQEPKSVGEVLADSGVRVHLFADSAEGIPTPIDRELASQRASRARERLLEGEASSG
jgi:hypothetical protein